MSQEVLEGNRLIAEFMDISESYHEKGVYISSKWPDRISATVSQMKYHTSWDWLMPVVEKIESMNYSVNILRTDCSVYDNSFRNSGDGFRENIKCKSKIEAVWSCVILFINFYNQTQKR